MPLTYNGVTITEFQLIFKNGKVVSYKAKENEETLASILELDDGAARLGEVALVPHCSPISQMNMLFNSTLYDENASCHVALGKAYPMIKDFDILSKEDIAQRGVNDSITHVDFMFGTEDLAIIGTTHTGQMIPVFENGNWTQ